MSHLRRSSLNCGQPEGLNAEFRETLDAAKAKNILRRVEKDLEAEPGLMGDSIRRLTEAIGDGIPHEHSHNYVTVKAVRVKRGDCAMG